MRQSLITACLAGLGILLLNGAFNGRGQIPVMSASSSQVAVFDFGDVPAPPRKLRTLPFVPFEATPPVSAAEPEPIPTSEVSAFNEEVPETPFATSDVSEQKPEPAAAAPTPIAAISLPKAEPEEAVGPVNPPPKAKPDLAGYVYPVLARPSGIRGGGVAVGPDMLLTVYHLAKYPGVEVGVNNKWMAASQVNSIHNANDGMRDGALVRVSGLKMPYLKVRAPRYRETVTVYGLKTKTAYSGIVSTSLAVSLDENCAGVASGDSGGAVVADSDGCLVGLISGFPSKNDQIGTPPEPRVVMMTRGDLFTRYIPQSPVQTASVRQVSEPSASSPPSAFEDPPKPATPPNESSWDQPSAFDPPVVNNAPNCSQPKMTAPNCSGPSYQYQQPQTTMYYYSPDCPGGVCAVPNSDVRMRGPIRRWWWITR